MGTQATITGTGFGEERGEVLLGMEKCQLLAWSNTEITFLVDKPQPCGNHTLTVLLNGDKQPAEPLTIYPFIMQRPQITVADPPAVLVPDGDILTIEGKFFGDKKGDLRRANLSGADLRGANLIGASLQDCAGLQVLAVDAEVHDAAHRLGVPRPDVVLFDLGAAQRDFAMTLCKARPDLLLIGMDLATNQALVVSGHRTRAYTTEDLLQGIQRHDPDKAETG